MYHLFGLIIIIAALSSDALEDKEYPAINITIAHTIPDYLVQYPNASVTKLPSSVISNWTNFEFGNNVEDDVLLAKADNSFEFHSPQDVTIELNYTLYRANVTRLLVAISVDSRPANCYITSFGTRNNSLIVWAQSKATKMFRYEVYLWGHKAIEYPSTKIQVDTKIEDYLVLHPSATVTRMNQTMGGNGKIIYYLGNRISDHYLVSTSNAALIFPFRDVALSLDYPQVDGTGANITYVEVYIAMAENATAYVVSGGIGKDYIKVWIQFKNMRILSYTAEIYGYFLE